MFSDRHLQKLLDWQALDLVHLRSRLETNPYSKPRIEISAHITKMNNLSVRWHPGGWRQAEFDWERIGRDTYNLITRHKWKQAPDFRWFTGDEEPTFQSRASNEIMYIRGVGNLRPEPRDDFGYYSTHNADVLDSILVCAVRATYEQLIGQLQSLFEVTTINGFHFETRDEFDESDTDSRRHAIHRVIAWSIKDAAELQLLRERSAAAAKDKIDRAELANMTPTFGFTREVFLAALLNATKSSSSASTVEQVNQRAAKDLRGAGFKVHVGNVRRIRDLFERYSPEIMPEELQPAAQPAPVKIEPPNNVVMLSQPRSDESK